MLPSQKRLSRPAFSVFLASKELKTVFNAIGTLKYQKNVIDKASIVISSKNEKRAVYRNRLRRRIYSLFGNVFKETDNKNLYVLYVSKQATSFTYEDLRRLFYELFKKTR